MPLKVGYLQMNQMLLNWKTKVIRQQLVVQLLHQVISKFTHLLVTETL
jgi:hypothetical protein